MFYRNQNYLLILVAICGILFYIMPFAKFDYHELPCSIGVLGFRGFELSSGNYIFWILRLFASAFVILAIVSLSLYKKRMLQLKFVMFTFLSNILLIGMNFFSIELLTKQIQYTGKVEYSLWIYIPIVTILFISMAQRGIKKDETIARSLDRLR
ncbi:hypothetical protein FACS1894153_0670 [Bacteroidia bacterium]|nr:hypothetical protein FACS1894153_0670 [Bacteroidia bacterium]